MNDRKSGRKKSKSIGRNSTGRKQFREQELKEIETVVDRYSTFDAKQAASFNDFPLSKKTLLGLSNGGYVEPTEIQRAAICFGLNGLDVLGAAKTGSGKTLAFIIPILEKLWRDKWSPYDGLGALIISPTRELALQTYEVLLSVGAEHDFSAALIIGGTEVQYEAKRIAGKNIIVCTPGRLLQHMDENPAFNWEHMCVLVIDEADRLLDMGFERQLNAVIANLPAERQTLLFSATQTRSVKDLARLSLKDPVYVSVHEHAQYSTPEQLQQSYIVCEEHEKFNMLWSFIKSHVHSKVLVFMTNCKQVRFYFEACRRFRPHTTLLALHGSMHQMKRVDVYKQFCHKQNVVLFATDIAARGLDFPAVDWVLQLDCPPDSNEYIHRCGRTARYKSTGEALLVLTPSQENAMLEELQSKKIPITKIEINDTKMVNVQMKMEIFCSQDNKLKTYAQRAFVAYARSLFLMSNKKIFDAQKIDYEALAKSFGLAITPRVRFLRKHASKSDNPPSAYSKPENAINKTDDEKCDEDKDEPKFEILPSSSKEGLHGWSDDEDKDENDSILVVKKRDVFNVGHADANEEKAEDTIEPEISPQSTVSRSSKAKPLTRVAVAKKILKKKITANRKIKFDQDDDISTNAEAKMEPVKTDSAGYSIEEARKRMEAEDKVDRQIYQKRIREKHKEEKRKRKLAEQERRGQSRKTEPEVTLGRNSDSDGDSEEQNETLRNAEGSSDQESFVDEIRSPQRKKIRFNSQVDVKADSDASNEEDDFELNLEDAERLAQSLLNS